MNFLEFARAHGLIVDDVVADGLWHRVPTEDHPRKRNGALKLAADGRIGWIQDHATHPEPLTWRPDRETVIPIDFAAIARRRAEARRALVDATQAARRFYADCKPLQGGHPYLESHGLRMDGCFGLRIDGDGWLVVPVMLDRNLMSVQRIGPDGEKRFWPGASVKAASYRIDRVEASITVLCEGLATGLAVFVAAPLTRVVVCFDAGNLPRVAIPRRGLVVVAADNDHGTQARLGHNPGMEAAQKAADALGCGVAAPAGIGGTDWCDFRRERLAGLMVARPDAREGDLRRAVDAEVAAAMMRCAKFLRPQLTA